jgi:predicted nucleotidyltransferase
MTVAPGIDVSDDEIAEICRKYGMKELAVFGSAARGELSPESDVDLLVEFLPDANISLLGHLAAERELSQLLGRKVDLVSKRALRSRLRPTILSQTRLLYAA